tara:strand:- start:174 stop:401 length:228 start_codon:yes stop_codon:yes gene_type:complete
MSRRTIEQNDPLIITFLLLLSIRQWRAPQKQQGRCLTQDASSMVTVDDGSRAMPTIIPAASARMSDLISNIHPGW